MGDTDFRARIGAALQHAENVQLALETLRDLLGLKHISFHLGQIQVGELDAPFVRTTYPSEWVSRYVIKGYINVDPVAREGFERQLPFDWSEVRLDNVSRELMEDAATHDLGRSGFSIPVIDRAGRRSLLSFTSDLVGVDWQSFLSHHGELLSEIAFQLHRKALIQVFGDADPMPPLGPREIECLMWTARGKDYLDIAEILGISGHTVRGYLKSARFKLECSTLPQAVAKALSLKVIKA
jgi:DNA-binding CsgD family transcriptional regulator